MLQSLFVIVEYIRLVERLARLNLGHSQQSTVTPSGPRVRHVAFAKVGDSRTSTSSAPSFVSRPRSKPKDTSKIEDHNYALPSSPWPCSQISVGDTEGVKCTKSGSQFVFKEWCVEKDLANLVVQALVDNEFVSLGALVGMSKDDIEELNLPKKGLVRALEPAVQDLQSAYGHEPLLPPKVLPGSTAEVIPVGQGKVFLTKEWTWIQESTWTSIAQVRIQEQ